MTQTPATPRLSVVIVNYNTREDLRACLDALCRCPFPLEIIVVDNASTDGSARMVSDHFPDVVLLAPGRNLWFTGGNNLGIAVAHGEFVLLLNPDTVPTPAALAAMLAFAETHPEYGGVTVQLRYPDGTVQRTCSRLPTFPYLLLNHSPLGWLLRGARDRARAAHWYGDWARDSDRDVDVPPGSCLLVRRAALRLDDTLQLYFPEDRLARDIGPERFRFLAGVSIVHREKAATRGWKATEIYFRDLLVYTGKTHGVAARALLWLLSRPVLWGMWLKRTLGA